MGVLSGYKIIELSGIGPGPLCGMLFADLGAEVIRVDRKNTVMPNQQPKFDITGRSKKSICLNLKDPESKEVLFKLIKNADALIEGYRPGATEKLGVTLLLKRAITVPSLPTRNFSKFHSTSPEGSI